MKNLFSFDKPQLTDLFSFSPIKDVALLIKLLLADAVDIVFTFEASDGS